LNLKGEPAYLPDFFAAFFLTAAVAFFLGATGAFVAADLVLTALADFLAAFFGAVGLVVLEVDALVAFFFEPPNAASQPLEYF
jgi:FtsH-binding integral membrane protein